MAAGAISGVEVPLVVVLGAGASRGASDKWENAVPPLTVDLFDQHLYGWLLEEYELAHQAGRYIASQCAGDDALSIEQVLHGMRVSDFEHHQRMAYAVPAYLQHLLHWVSEKLYRQAFRYDQLIERLLRLPEVCFITLNYDVMLDRRLAAHHPLNRVDDYISRDKNWSLVKLHGSVNWVYESVFLEPRPVGEPLMLDGDLQVLPPSAPLESIRTTVGGGNRYPALALPEGPDDRLVLPETHQAWIRHRLAAPSNIDLLVIGYSGLDVEVLKLLQEAGTQVRLMTIVNQSLQAAIEVRDRFNAAGINATWTETAAGDFNEWVRVGELDKLVAQFGGPYPDAY